MTRALFRSAGCAWMLLATASCGGEFRFADPDAAAMGAVDAPVPEPDARAEPSDGPLGKFDLPPMTDGGRPDRRGGGFENRNCSPMSCRLDCPDHRICTGGCADDCF